MNRSRTIGRVLVAATLLLTTAASVPALAHAPGAADAPGGPPPAPSRSGGPGAVYDRVAHFYGAYIDIANDPGSNAAASELRKFYLTPGLRARLLDWEKQHDADGILRSQHVPSAWKVTPGDSGMGHTYTTVRLTWDSGAGTGGEKTYTYLTVRSDLESRKISEITAQ
ncbi:hypothetical protein G5C60_27150 [Streptomyces sp. HC44]|uniref:Secreted protein n=1 Tax=Streptomyces scabichelini TaxID=2711217 RepID=A0A6G4VBG3_9ACTN|nr:hypothetical protein [Streptomyces scabichelini]NGO11180.1 hypothetical protein [Streptomyces scabichelini]